MINIFDNIYGHKNRLNWFKKFVSPDHKGLEFGCGTGIMITSQLIQEGFDIEGIDLDHNSINYGKDIFEIHNINSEKISCKNLNAFPDNYLDYIIASEVFEHINKQDLPPILDLIKRKLKNKGILLVTVPNGFGWYELEAFFWKELRIGKVLMFLKIPQVIYSIKKNLLKLNFDSPYLSTLDESPHVRRFTHKSIRQTFTDENFEVTDIRGSVFFCGQFSNMFFSGCTLLTKLNTKLGKYYSKYASGFYIAGELKK